MVMNSIIKKLAVAALIVSVAFCGPFVTSRAEAAECADVAVAVAADFLSEGLAVLAPAWEIGRGSYAVIPIVNDTIFGDDMSLDNEESSALQADLAAVLDLDYDKVAFYTWPSPRYTSCDGMGPCGGWASDERGNFI